MILSFYIPLPSHNLNYCVLPLTAKATHANETCRTAGYQSVIIVSYIYRSVNIFLQIFSYVKRFAMDLSQLHFRLIFSPYFGLFITPTHLFCMRFSYRFASLFKSGRGVHNHPYTVSVICPFLSHTAKKSPPGAQRTLCTPAGFSP